MSFTIIAGLSRLEVKSRLFAHVNTFDILRDKHYFIPYVPLGMRLRDLQSFEGWPAATVGRFCERRLVELHILPLLRSRPSQTLQRFASFLLFIRVYILYTCIISLGVSKSIFKRDVCANYCCLKFIRGRTSDTRADADARVYRIRRRDSVKWFSLFLVAKTGKQNRVINRSLVI